MKPSRWMPWVSTAALYGAALLFAAATGTPLDAVALLAVGCFLLGLPMRLAAQALKRTWTARYGAIDYDDPVATAALPDEARGAVGQQGCILFLLSAGWSIARLTVLYAAAFGALPLEGL